MFSLISPPNRKPKTEPTPPHCSAPSPHPVRARLLAALHCLATTGSSLQRPRRAQPASTARPVATHDAPPLTSWPLVSALTARPVTTHDAPHLTSWPLVSALTARPVAHCQSQPRASVLFDYDAPPRFDASRSLVFLWITCGQPVENLWITLRSPLSFFALQRVIHFFSTGCPQVIHRLSTGCAGGVDAHSQCSYTIG